MSWREPTLSHNEINKAIKRWREKNVVQLENVRFEEVSISHE